MKFFAQLLVCFTLIAFTTVHAQEAVMVEEDVVVDEGVVVDEEIVTIEASAAAAHIGKMRCVCGTVMGTRYLDQSEKKPTFLNIDQVHPNQPFTVVVMGEDRDKFPGAPEVIYAGKKICVTGKVEEHKGIPQIVVTNPDMVEVGGDATSAEPATDD